MKNVSLEWYVLNDCRWREYPEGHPFSKYPYSGSIKPWNIFNNCVVYERTLKLCEEYKRKKMTFETFTESLRNIIMCEEWSRCEYEIMVNTLFPNKERPEGWKIDCYMQALPNIKHIARYVLQTYYPRIKIQENSPKEVEKVDEATFQTL